MYKIRPFSNINTRSLLCNTLCLVYGPCLYENTAKLIQRVWFEVFTMQYQGQITLLLISLTILKRLRLLIFIICKEMMYILYFFLLILYTWLSLWPTFFFGPWKVLGVTSYLPEIKTEGRTQASVPKNCFPRLLKKKFERLDTNVKNNVFTDFSKTGISPLNKIKQLERLRGNSTRNKTCTYAKRILNIRK